MIILLITIILGLVFAYFATLNTKWVEIKFDSYIFPLPLYIVILGSMLLGIVIATIIHFIDSFSNYLAFRRKENLLKELKKTVAELIERVHMLEIREERREQENGGTNPIKEGNI